MTSVNLMKSVVVAAALAAAGCGSEGTRAPAAGGMIEQDSLRVRTDAARGRLWVLGVDDVRVYDAASRRLIRQIPLPGWSVATSVCDPDLVLDPAGTAIISSNVQSRLWQVDGGTFEVRERTVSLQGKEGWEIGFGALGVAADGTLFALTSTASSLWKIDAAGASASLVESYHPPLKEGCVLATRFTGRLERAPRS